MIKNFSGILYKKFLVLSFFLVLFGFSIYFPLPWDDPIDDAVVSLQHKIRGSRAIENDFIIVYIGDEDLQALGGWPLTRDYYSYLIHILTSSGAKVIALDLLFANSDPRHPEFDKTLSDFIRSAGNLCLPMIFSEIIPAEENRTDHSSFIFYGDNPTLPLRQFADHSAGIGFSNFSQSNNVLRVPVMVLNEDRTFFSFGAQMAKLFISSSETVLPNQNGLLQLNHFGNINDVQSISFIELLKKYQMAADSVNFENKLILLTVTAPGISSVKSTPLSDALPASLVHLTVAENLINETYLTRISLHTQAAILILILISVYLALNFKTEKLYSLFCGGLLIVLWIFSILAFSMGNLIIPLFYPSLALLSSFIYFLADRVSQKHTLQSSMSDLLQQQIDSKEEQLQEAREQSSKQANTSEELLRLAEQRKQNILELEKDISDLKIYSASDKNRSEINLNFKDIIYSKTSPMREVLELVLKVSPSDIPVLIMGETGTGKEMIARAIHLKSGRKNNPFVAVNCGALSETLLESELFGHEKGSFTGAATLRRGRFELANGGSIFLDEISETSPAFQAKLLRVVQESTFERLGGEKTLKTNIRIIAATNKNLEAEMEEDRFRADLFYRLNGFPINLPLLRERPDDIPILVQHFLKKYKYKVEISDQAIKILKKYPWPGNIRELENQIRRAALIAESDNHTLIRENDFEEVILKANSNSGQDSIHKSIEEQILETMRSLSFSHSSISQTAKLLGNRDRGTVTEYFRGICFEYLVNAHFDLDQAAGNIAGSEDEKVVNFVKAKINTYLKNLDDNTQSKSKSLYKGLPKKYHPFLEKVLNHLNK